MVSAYSTDSSPDFHLLKIINYLIKAAYSNCCLIPIGVPVLPTEVVLQYLEKSSVLISWQYDGSDLQPADKFTITVQTTSTQQHVGLSRRQAGNVQVPSLSPNDVWEYETEKTSLVVELTDNSKRYVITVCAVNEFGSECTEPQELKEYTGEPQQPEKQIGDPRDVNTNSLQVEAAGLEQQDVLVVEGKPSRGLVIAIAVVAPVMALVLCMALICAIVICRCYGRSKEYYPARQGIIQGISLLTDLMKVPACKGYVGVRLELKIYIFFLLLFVYRKNSIGKH